MFLGTFLTNRIKGPNHTLSFSESKLGGALAPLDVKVTTSLQQLGGA